MTTPLLFKIRTIIANSEANDAQKNALEAHVGTLTEGDIAQLISVFRKHPKTVAVYADYLAELAKQPQPVSPEQFEKTLSAFVSRLT